MKLPFRSPLIVAILVLTPFVFMGGQCNLTDPPGTELKTGSLTADFTDGTSFISSIGTAKKRADNTIFIQATQNVVGAQPDELQIIVPDSALLPFTVTMPGPNSSVLLGYCVTNGSSCKQYFAEKGQGSCTINITKLTPTVEGTFNGIVIQRGVTDSARTITGGSFKVAYE